MRRILIPFFAGALGIAIVLAAVHIYKDHETFHVLVQLAIQQQQAKTPAPPPAAQ